MEEKKKQSKLKKCILMIAPIAILGAVLYFMFRNNYNEILEGLSNANLSYLVLMILMGLSYYCLDAIPFYCLVKRSLPSFKYWEALEMLFIGIFLNVSTAGTGIKPGETFYLYKKGNDVGKSIGQITLPYNYHKVAVMIFATVMLFGQNKFIKETFADSYDYIYMGYGMCAIIVLALVLLVASKTFHKLIFWPLNKIFKAGKWYERKEKWRGAVTNLRVESQSVVRDWKIAVQFLAVDLLKFLIWYIIPFIAYEAVCGVAPDYTLIEIIAAAAFMQLITGAIPNVGGMGTAEVVYTLVFSVLYGDVIAGTTMVLFRFVTFYIPVIISIGVMARVSRYLYR